MATRIEKPLSALDSVIVATGSITDLQFAHGNNFPAHDEVDKVRPLFSGLAYGSFGQWESCLNHP
jgi:hypothetical protein